ncbi:MAG: EAL domain-containing protein [Pseudomonadota bacterium]
MNFRLSALPRPLRTSLRWRLAASIALVHALMMAIFVFDLTSREQDLLVQNEEASTLNTAALLARSSFEWVLARDLAGLGELIMPLARSPDTAYVMILDREGRVLAHSEGRLVGQYLRDPSSLAALRPDADGPRLVQSTTTLVDGIAPIIANHNAGERTGQIVGWARIGTNTSRTHAALKQVMRDGLFYTLAAILIGTLLALIISADLTRDLRRMKTLFQRVSAGDLDQRIEVVREDELGSLMQGLNHMLERLEANERLLKDTQERLELALRGSNDGLWDWDLNAHRVYYSPRWKSMLGYEDGDIGDAVDEWASRVHPDDLSATMDAIQAHLEGRSPAYESIHRVRHKDGHWLWILDRGIALRDSDGKPYRMVGTHTDITRRIELEHNLSLEKERLRIVLMSMADGVIATNAKGRIEFLNPVAEELTGWTLAEAMEHPLEQVAQLITDDNAPPLDREAVGKLLRGDRHGITARLLRHGENQRFNEIELKISPIEGGSGAEGHVLILHDISETHRLMEQMSWQASHDPLTALPNRTAFGERLKALLEGTRKAHEQHALLYMDLDQFKVVNDTCGHHAGDELLVNIAHLLRNGVRREDMIARLGGDEFAALLTNCPVDDAERIAQQLRESVQDFSFYWQDRVFNVGVSIGIVTIGPTWNDADEILRAADIACYTAKEHGRNRIHVYEAADEAMSRQVEQLGMASQIQLAVRESRFVLHAQPLRPLTGDALDDGLYLEVLVRMLDRHGQLIAPGLFISAAERYNLMQAIDRWVISTTLESLKRALGTPTGRSLKHVGINLSGNSLTDEGMLAYVEEEVRRHHFPPGLICFEITETAIISNMHQALAFIQRMKALGCTFALDDFGSGLSSFAYLKALPVDYLKIDGVFVRDIESDPHDRTFVQAINQVGRTLGLKTIAEFVENTATETILRDMGVDFAQGYGVSAPKPLESFLGSP